MHCDEVWLVLLIDMTLSEEYDDLVRVSKIYPKNRTIEYPVLGMCGETGEVAEKVKKTIRDNRNKYDAATKAAILKELGDVLWYLVATTQDLGYTFDDVIENNMTKVNNRIATNTQHGKGDNREEV